MQRTEPLHPPRCRRYRRHRHRRRHPHLPPWEPTSAVPPRRHRRLPPPLLLPTLIAAGRPLAPLCTGRDSGGSQRCVAPSAIYAPSACSGAALCSATPRLPSKLVLFVLRKCLRSFSSSLLRSRSTPPERRRSSSVFCPGCLRGQTGSGSGTHRAGPSRAECRLRAVGRQASAATQQRVQGWLGGGLQLPARGTGDDSHHRSLSGRHDAAPSRTSSGSSTPRHAAPCPRSVAPPPRT